ALVSSGVRVSDQDFVHPQGTTTGCYDPLAGVPPLLCGRPGGERTTQQQPALPEEGGGRNDASVTVEEDHPALLTLRSSRIMGSLVQYTKDLGPIKQGIQSANHLAVLEHVSDGRMQAQMRGWGRKREGIEQHGSLGQSGGEPRRLRGNLLPKRVRITSGNDLAVYGRAKELRIHSIAGFQIRQGVRDPFIDVPDPEFL